MTSSLINSVAGMTLVGGGSPKKLCVDSVTSLETLAYRVDTASEVDSGFGEEELSEAPSQGPEPSDTTGQDHAEDDGEDEEDEDEKILASLGFANFPGGGDDALLVVPTSNEKPLIRGAIEPPKLQNLFWRQYTASRELPHRLTEARLAAHDAVQTRGQRAEVQSSTDGDWLHSFKEAAHLVPVTNLTTEICGYGIGASVAKFLGGDALKSPSERDVGDIDISEALNGQRVVGSRLRRCSTGTRGGRVGFAIEDDISISTPDRHPSSQSDLESECSDLDGQDTPREMRDFMRPHVWGFSGSL